MSTTQNFLKTGEPFAFTHIVAQDGYPIAGFFSLEEAQEFALELEILAREEADELDDHIPQITVCGSREFITNLLSSALAHLTGVSYTGNTLEDQGDAERVIRATIKFLGK